MMHRPGSDTVQWGKANTEARRSWGREKEGSRQCMKRKAYNIAEISYFEVLAMTGITWNEFCIICQFQHMPYGTSAGALNQHHTAVNHTVFPTKNSLQIPLEGKPHRADRIRASLHLGELVGQGKSISLTTVPHEAAVVDSRNHGVGQWNNWEVNLSKCYSQSLLSRPLTVFFLPSRDCLNPQLLSNTQLEISHLKQSCCSSKCIWQPSVGIRSTIHQTKAGHKHLN